MIRTITLVFALLLTAGAVHSQNLDGRLKKIAATKIITIAYRADAAPFSFMDDKKQVTGFSVDLCKRVANLIERQLNVQGLQVKWLPVTIQTRFDAIAKGQADMQALLAQSKIGVDIKTNDAAARKAELELRAQREVLDNEAIAAMEKRGLKMLPMTPELEKEWRGLAERAYPHVRGTMVPAETFDRVRAILDERRGGKP